MPNLNETSPLLANVESASCTGADLHTLTDSANVNEAPREDHSKDKRTINLVSVVGAWLCDLLLQVYRFPT